MTQLEIWYLIVILWSRYYLMTLTCFTRKSWRGVFRNNQTYMRRCVSFNLEMMSSHIAEWKHTIWKHTIYFFDVYLHDEVFWTWSTFPYVFEYLQYLSQQRNAAHNKIGSSVEGEGAHFCCHDKYYKTLGCFREDLKYRMEKMNLPKHSRLQVQLFQ